MYFGLQNQVATATLLKFLCQFFNLYNTFKFQTRHSHVKILSKIKYIFKMFYKNLVLKFTNLVLQKKGK